MINIDFKDIVISKFYPVLNDIIGHKYTHYWFKGGRGSTKSSFISLVLPLLLLLNKNIHCLVLRKVSATIKDSVYNQILWGLDKLDIAPLFKTTVNPLEITYIPTGQKIFFRGSDEPIKIKSIKPKFGYIGTVWFEELDQFRGEEEIRNILQSANRGGDKYWNFYSFNPPKSRDNWANVAVLEDRPDKIVTHNTYLDTPVGWLGKQFIIEAEHLKKVKPKSYEHEYLGIAIGNGGNVFDNIEVREITNEEINNMDYFYYGIDFGYTIDPFVWIKVAYNAKMKTLYIIDEIYGVQITNSKAVELIKAKTKNQEIYITADTEVRAISDLNERGLRVGKTSKYNGSVNYGIKWLQDLEKIVIDNKRTPNAYREFINYEYEVDRYGNFLNNYPDKNNHTIDAVRYALTNVASARSVKWG